MSTAVVKDEGGVEVQVDVWGGFVGEGRGCGLCRVPRYWKRRQIFG